MTENSLRYEFNDYEFKGNEADRRKLFFDILQDNQIPVSKYEFDKKSTNDSRFSFMFLKAIPIFFLIFIFISCINFTGNFLAFSSCEGFQSDSDKQFDTASFAFAIVGLILGFIIIGMCIYIIIKGTKFWIHDTRYLNVPEYHDVEDIKPHILEDGGHRLERHAIDLQADIDKKLSNLENDLDNIEF